jgi:hypothetical protein
MYQIEMGSMGLILVEDSSLSGSPTADRLSQNVAGDRHSRTLAISAIRQHRYPQLISIQRSFHDQNSISEVRS